MPGITPHMVVAKIVGKRLNITSPDFIRGNILPDLVNNPDSHHKIRGKYYLIPDIEFFKRNLNLNNEIELGYFTHLLFDKYFLEDYVLNYIDNLNIFEDNMIYQDYSAINYLLVKEFDLDIPYLVSVLSEINGNVNEEKKQLNLKFLTNKKTRDSKYLDFKIFSSFLYNISSKICEDIQSYMRR